MNSPFGANAVKLLVDGKIEDSIEQWMLECLMGGYDQTLFLTGITGKPWRSGWLSFSRVAASLFLMFPREAISTISLMASNKSSWLCAERYDMNREIRYKEEFAYGSVIGLFMAMGIFSRFPNFSSLGKEYLEFDELVPELLKEILFCNEAIRPLPTANAGFLSEKIREIGPTEVVDDKAKKSRGKMISEFLRIANSVLKRNLLKENTFEEQVFREFSYLVFKSMGNNRIQMVSEWLCSHSNCF